MTKIELPPCEFWPGATACCAAEFVEGGEMGLCKYLREQAKCEYYKPEGGFDAVAAAIRKAGLFYELKDPYPNKDSAQCQVEIITEPRFRGWRGVKVEGPTFTAALVAAVNKANS